MNGYGLKKIKVQKAFILLTIGLLLGSYKTSLVCAQTDAFEAKNGEGKGGGGDSRCQDFSSKMLQISWEIKKLAANSDVLAKNLPGLDMKALHSLAAKNKCLPVTVLPRQALSFPAQNLTKLLVSEYEKLNLSRKTQLIIHELAVLAKMEKDGEYFISGEINKTLMQNSRYFKIVLVDAQTTIFNSDNSVTFINPKIEVGEKSYFIAANNIGNYQPANSVCPVYGLKPVNSFWKTNMLYSGEYVFLAGGSFGGERPGIITGFGKVTENAFFYGESIIENISCE